MLAPRDQSGTKRAPTRPERGAVAVEFALILPLLAMLLVGVVTAGLALSHGLGLTNAVREGSRFAATAPFDPNDPDQWEIDVIARTRATQFDDQGATPDTKVCAWLIKNTTPVTTLASDCDGPSIGNPDAFTIPPGTPPDGCVVRVWGAREYTINAILLSWKDRVMARQSIGVYERLPCEAATP